MEGSTTSRRRPRRGRRAAFAVLLWLASAGAALAHEGDPVIEADPATIAPGGGVHLVVFGLDPSTDHRLTLEGVERQVALGDIRTDAAGSIDRVVEVPDGVPPGVYGVKLSDGRELAVSTVIVVDPAAGIGHEIPRVPWALVLFGSAAAAAVVLVGLRLRGRRPRPTVADAAVR